MSAVAVVTGAGRGFGLEIARSLGARGYAVLVTDVDAAAAEAAAAEVGEGAWAMELDVRDPDAHRLAAAAAIERGPLEVWVNNAGVLRVDKPWNHSDHDVRLMVEANLLGVMWGSRAFVEAIAAGPSERAAHLINIASLSAFGPVPGLAVYAATKHGVLGFTTSLQGDLDAAGVAVRTHVVCPDTADTGMVREQAGQQEAAVQFSGPKVLSAAEVAERTVALLGGERMVLSIPPARGLLVRSLAPWPRFGLRIASLFGRLGERRRRRYLEQLRPGS